MKGDTGVALTYLSMTRYERRLSLIADSPDPLINGKGMKGDTLIEGSPNPLINGKV